MPARESEAFVLRTYPYREADLIVNFVARDQGKLRGTARGARRPKSRFGSGLERLAHTRIFYFQRQNRELVSLDRCELIGPPLFLRADYATSLALDYVVEVCDQLLPEHEPNDAFFRLLRLVAAEMWAGMNEASRSSATGPVGEPELVAAASGRANGAALERSASEAGTPQQGNRMRGGEGPEAPGWLWRVVTYFSLWAVRLGGWLPPLNVFIQSGVELKPDETAYFERSHPGLFSAEFRTPDSWPLTPLSRSIAVEMLKKPLDQLEPRSWSRPTAEDLRRFLVQRLEAQFERQLKTAAELARL